MKKECKQEAAKPAGKAADLLMKKQADKKECKQEAGKKCDKPADQQCPDCKEKAAKKN